MSGNRHQPSEAENKAQAVEATREALGKPTYGSISLTLHEGRTVQPGVTQKSRFNEG